jgi:hypothetical protein
VPEYVLFVRTLISMIFSRLSWRITPFPATDPDKSKRFAPDLAATVAREN